MPVEAIGFLAIGWVGLVIFIKTMVGERQKRPWSATPDVGLQPIPTSRQLRRQAFEDWDREFEELSKNVP